MAKKLLIDRIKEGTFFVDGAMGTQLMALGARWKACNDELNIDAAGAAIVKKVHEFYLASGCDAVIANTFGASGVTLAKHGLADKCVEINKAGAEIARDAADAADGDRYVLGDIGPCGEFLEPLGTLTAAELLEGFKSQVQGLVQGGVDGFIIETMTAIEEVAVAVDAVKAVSDLPVFVALAYDKAGDEFRTMMGVDPGRVVETLAEKGVTAIGFNCGTLGMDDYVRLAEVCAEAIEGTDIVLIAEPNAGQPELIDSKAVYTLPDEDFAEASVGIRDAGASIMGGCCGTSPKHIGAMIKKLSG